MQDFLNIKCNPANDKKVSLKTLSLFTDSWISHIVLNNPTCEFYVSYINYPITFLFHRQINKNDNHLSNSIYKGIDDAKAWYPIQVKYHKSA